MGYRLRTDIIDDAKDKNGNVPVLFIVPSKHCGNSKVLRLSLNAESAKWFAEKFDLATLETDITRYVEDRGYYRPGDKIHHPSGVEKDVVAVKTSWDGHDRHTPVWGALQITEKWMPNLRMESNYR